MSHSIRSSSAARLFIALLVTCCSHFAAPAFSAVFVALPGIDGGTTDRNHQGAMNVLSLENVFTKKGNHLGCGEISFTKPLDRASSQLLPAVVAGSTFPQGVIMFADLTSTGAFDDYYVVHMNDIRLTGIAQYLEASKEYERITLVARSFNISYRGADGKLTQPQFVPCLATFPN